MSKKRKRIVVTCPICEEARITNYYDTIRYGHTKCKGCAKIKDMTGKRFSRLVGIKFSHKEYLKGAHWLWQCDCGNKITAIATNVRRGSTTSCGCFNADQHKRTGKDNPKYDTSLSDEDRQRNKTPNYYKWRKSVLERDKYSCQRCKKSNSRTAHHINSWNSHKEERFNVDNGITLCNKCHKEFHKIYGNGDNTTEQFLEWLPTYHSE